MQRRSRVGKCAAALVLRVVCVVVSLLTAPSSQRRMQHNDVAQSLHFLG